jgi:hypothetical protein
MTPQEYAKDLCKSMYGFRVKKTHMKKCAKEAAERLYKEANIFTRKDYFKEVIDEIDKL